MRHLKILVSLLLCLYATVYAQDPVLNTTISINYRDAKLKDVLLGLERNYHVKFYYANNLIPLHTRVSIHKTNAPLGEVLQQLFRNSEVEYVAVSGKIVLKKSMRPRSGSKQGQAQPVSVMTANASLEEPIDPATLQPAFNLSEVKSVPVVDERTFALPELNLRDSLITPLSQTYSQQKNKLLKRYMAKMDSLSKIGDIGSMESLKVQFVEAMGKLKAKVKAASIAIKAKEFPLFRDTKDTARLTSPFQLTLVTPLGTNGHLSSQTTNKVSFNVWVGYAYALDGVEFGGLCNNERATVNGAQFAGISNVVGSDVNGGQFAGIANVSGGMVNGAQFAGIVNINGDSATGMQAAGISNVNNGSFMGTQLAGISNVNNGSGAGFQAAGIANVNDGSMRGVQIAGIANIAKAECDGAQIAGVLNRAKRVRGSQIGLINIADTVTGATIGLLNIVKNGYNKFEVYGAEALYANAAFRFGTRGFHTILAVGIKPSSDSKQAFFSYGLGFGSALALAPKVDMHFDLMANHLNHGFDRYTDRMNLLNQFKTTVSYKLANHLHLFAGPSFNVLVSQQSTESLAEPSVYGNTFSNTSYQNKNWEDGYDKVNVKLWLGFNAGLRF